MRNTQYSTPEKLNARALLHAKYSKNALPWHEWLFSTYIFHDTARIIEFECGTGDLWFHNRDKIKASWEIVLTDSSEGMVLAAKEKLGRLGHNIKFRCCDLNTHRPEINQYSHCIANHMLYHVADKDYALNAIHTLLEPGAYLYASTIS